MANKFTPGPWEYDSKNSNIIATTVYLNEEEQDEDYKINVSVVSLYGAMGGNNTEADAQLMASAPEMFEALNKIKETVLQALELSTIQGIEIDFKNLSGHLAEMAERAINKATGGQ